MIVNDLIKQLCNIDTVKKKKASQKHQCHAFNIHRLLAKHLSDKSLLTKTVHLELFNQKSAELIEENLILLLFS